MNPLGSLGSGPVILATVTTSAVFVVALWTLGLVTTPSPRWLGVLVLCSIVLSAVSVYASMRTSGTQAIIRAVGSAVGGASLLANAAFVVSLLSSRSGPATISRFAAIPRRPAERLRIVNFNVFHGYPRFPDHERRRRDLVEALRRLDPDVIVLQEVSITTIHGNLATTIAAALSMDVAYARANGSRRLIGFEEGAAVLSRFPILNARSISLSPRKRPWENRNALVASLSLGGDRQMSIVDVHLADRAVGIAGLQVRDLLQRISPRQVQMIAGDFNAPSGSDAVDAVTSRGFVDVLPGGVDHVCVSVGAWPWRVLSANWTLRPEDLVALIGHGTEISDHPGIVVELAAR